MDKIGEGTKVKIGKSKFIRGKKERKPNLFIYVLYLCSPTPS